MSAFKYQWNQTIDVGTAGPLSKQWTSIRHILSLLVTANDCVHVTAYVAVRRSLSTTYTAVVLARGGVLGQVSDRDAPHRPSTRNATRVKKGCRNYTFCPILMKNRGRNTTFSSFLLKYRGQNTTFSSFLLKYRGRNSTNFPGTWKRGVETEEHI